MVEIRNDIQLAAWLKGRERQDAIAIAARSALRALPIIAQIFEKKVEEPCANFVLPVLRAALASRLAAVQANREAIEEEASSAASSAAFAAIAAVIDLSSASSVSAAASSAAFAAFASSADSDHSTAASNSALDSSYSADSAAHWNMISADVAVLEEGNIRKDVITAPLWKDGPPDWVSENWAIIASTLREAEDEDWEFWIAWYEARLQGGPSNEPLERAIVLIDEGVWKQGPRVVNAEIRRLIGVHSSPPETPTQEPAPVLAEIRDGEISRRDPDSPAPEADMAKIHGLLLTEAQWLSSNLSQQHAAVCVMIGNTVTALGEGFAQTDALTLGFHSKPLAARAATANEDLLEDQAARLQGFSANLDLFVLRLEDWRAHIAKAAAHPVTAEEVEAVAEETKSLLDGIRAWSNDLYDERIPAMLDELYVSLSEDSVYGVETPYGFYLSLRNVLTITLQAAMNAIPSDFIREESDEIIKAIRKKARKFVHDYSSELVVVTGVGLLGGLKAALSYVLGL